MNLGLSCTVRKFFVGQLNSISMKTNIISFFSLVIFSIFFSSAGYSQCSVNAGTDTTVYYGYAPLACVDLSAVPTGTPPFRYTWSQGDTTASIRVCDTADAVYIVSVTDSNGCVASDTVLVTVVDVRCGSNGNKVTVCHIPPGNPSNAHTICVDAHAVPAHLAHGCQLGACSGSPTPPPPGCNLNFGNDTSACGHFVLDAGSGAASYLWSDGSTAQRLTITVSGTYSATVTDSSGCVASDTIDITIYPLPVADAGPDTTLSAPGCVLLTGSASGGTPPYSLVWSHGATTDTSTVCDTADAHYILMVSDSNGCMASDTVHIIISSLTPPAVCDTHKVEICHIPLGNPSNMHTICVAQEAVSAHLAHGDILGPCANGNRTAPEGQIFAVPNPFFIESNIEFTLYKQGPARIEIMDLNGMIIKVLNQIDAESHTPYQVRFTPENLRGGIYLARVVSGNLPPVVHKIIYINE